MDTDLKKLKKLIKFCQKEGIQEYKTPELSFSLAPHAFAKADLKTLDEHKTPEEKSPQYTEEDTLFWSTQHIPDESREVQ